METGPYRATVIDQLGAIRQDIGSVIAKQEAAAKWMAEHDAEHVGLKGELDAANKAAGDASSKVQTVYTVIGCVFALAGLGAAVAPLFT